MAQRDRVAYEIRCPYVFVALGRFVFVLLLGLFLIAGPYLISPDSPRFYYTQDGVYVEDPKVDETGIDIIETRQRFGVEFYYASATASYDEASQKKEGTYLYCSISEREIMAYGISQDNLTLWNSLRTRLVQACVLDLNIFGTTVTAYGVRVRNQKSSETEKGSFFFRREEIQKSYSSEVMTALLISGVYIALDAILEVLFLCFKELRFRTRFTFVERSQIPRHVPQGGGGSRELVDDDREPFMVARANTVQFGRQTMRRGCLVTPKFLDDGEGLLNKFQLEVDLPGGLPDHAVLRPGTGLWKILAVSSRHTKERVIGRYKARPSRLLCSWAGCFSIWLFPLGLVVVVGALLLCLQLVIRTFGAIQALSMYIVIVAMIGAYIILSTIEFIAGIVQAITEQVIITDSRFVLAHVDRFNYRIEYSFYDDLVTDVTFGEKCQKLPQADVNDELLQRIFGSEDVAPPSGDQRSFSGHLQALHYLKLYCDESDLFAAIKLINQQRGVYDRTAIDDESDQEDDEEEEKDVIGPAIDGGHAAVKIDFGDDE